MQASAQGDSELYRSYVVPFILFSLLLLLFPVADATIAWDHPDAAWWQRAPEMIIYPLQTILCGGYLWWVRRGIEWDWKLRPCLSGALLGIPAIGLWLVPYFMGWVEVSGGFDPAALFGEHSVITYGQYFLRFVRAVVIVALVEELFWRGFLMRWCVNRDEPQSVPLGTHSWLGYAVTTVGFMLIHQPQDYVGALLFGSIAYILTIKTRQLMPVVLYHAVANLVMGICAIAFGMSGLW